MTAKLNSIELNTSQLDRLLVELGPRTRQIIQEYGEAVAGEWASGEPYVTGALRNSIRENSRMTGAFTYTVSDGVPYGARVDLGFHGRDSLGRMYNQAGTFALVIALDKYKERFFQAFKRLFQ